MTTLTLQPAAAAGIDTSVQEGNADTNYGTDAQIDVLGFASVRSNGLLKFDLSGIPAGAEIISATLSLFGLGGGSNGTLNIFRILAANSGWTEDGATWNYANSANETRWAGDAASNGGTDAGCSVSGTDHSATTMGQISHSHTADTEGSTELDLDEFALMWANNYGMVIKDSTASATTKQPASSDNPTAGRRPKLVIEYELGALLMQHHHKGGL